MFSTDKLLIFAILVTVSFIGKILIRLGIVYTSVYFPVDIVYTKSCTINDGNVQQQLGIVYSMDRNVQSNKTTVRSIRRQRETGLTVNLLLCIFGIVYTCIYIFGQLSCIFAFPD